MIYETYIDRLRRQFGDNKKVVHVDWIGNGSDTIFQMPEETYPVLEGSYTVKIASATKTENTDYTLDRNTGTLTIIGSAPSNGTAITIDSSSVHLTDQDWIDVINATIRSLGKDFFKEAIDTSLTATTGYLSLSLASVQPYCIAVYGFQHRRNINEDWVPVENYMNWRYDAENNTIYLGLSNIFLTGELFRLRILKGYTFGSIVTDALDVQDEFLTILEYGCGARFYRYRYKNVIELVSKQSTESSRTPLQELIMLSDRFDRLYEIEKAKLKPQKPARIIPQYKQGGGNP